MRKPTSIDEIREQASAFVVRMEKDNEWTEAECEELQQWLLADPRHAKEWMACADIADGAKDLSEDAKERFIASIHDSSRKAKSGRRRRFIRWGIAAGLATAFALAGWLYLLWSLTYTTQAGQARTVLLADGTAAHLNTRTTLKLVPGEHSRRVKLVKGEVLFDVVHDASHPFSVLVDTTEIRVLGTQFNVYRRSAGEVVVTVLEGAVEVREPPRGERPGWKRHLRQNEQLSFQADGLLRDVHQVVALNAIKWRDGELRLEDEPLPQALQELARYTDHAILTNDDAQLAHFRVAGTLTVKDVRVALDYIENLYPVSVTEDGNAFVVEYRPKPGESR